MDRAAQTFPILTPAQVERIAAFGRRRTAPAGELLYDVGDQSTRFYVVLTGAIEVVQPAGSVEKPIVVHGPGQFTGEINMLSARRSLVRARTTAPSDLLVLEREDLRRLVQRDSELSELLMRAFILRRLVLLDVGADDVVLVGSRHSADTMRIREFLSRNGQPFTYEDVETDKGVQALLDRFEVGVNDVPIVICHGGHVLKNPPIEKLASLTGLDPELDAATVRDVVIIGAGPAGLAAAVYGASEGLNVLVLESSAPGGQAGSSSRIENYLGFPTGISGQALAGRALTQAEKFGAEVAIGRTALRIDCDSRPYRVHLSDGQEVRTRAIVLAPGVKYRKLALPSLPRFEGAGVFYSATRLEGQLCAGEEIAIVGGGNSAGQAAVYLSSVARRVNVLVRGPGLAESMSRYLIQRIEAIPNIDLRTRCQVVALEGRERLEQVTWAHSGTGKQETRDIGSLFLMTGADPNTGWLKGCVLMDDKGFIKTGLELMPDDLAAAKWRLARRPFLLESSIPGVFCVGDARSNSVKRVAAAVGEGATCIQLMHSALEAL
ncbi:MAG TPA: FAD-dependent oxidoreductase [Polyangia bacterium]|jgi:thioredoxin reductase (NADPH)|nr:FAD-dependent oxidoreductase [Polyangia bacterium]